MVTQLLVLIIFMFIFSAVVQDRMAVTLMYVFLGMFVFSRWWLNRAIDLLSFSREYQKNAFPGEVVPVSLEIKNHSLLPVVWLRVQDNLSLEISDESSFRQVATIGSKESVNLVYELRAKHRGFYQVGPVKISTGDLLGIFPEETRQGKAEYFCVFPRILSFASMQLNSRSPLGTLKAIEPIFEDPNRPIGKRNYIPGDSLRRVDWKSSAAVGRTQVKIFEPSVDLQVALFLNLSSSEYALKQRLEAAELAIETTASIAFWAVQNRQSVGLWTNGIDTSRADAGGHKSIPPKKGRSHLIKILEVLARVKLNEGEAFSDFLHHHLHELSWGTSIMLLTGEIKEDVLAALAHAQRKGLNSTIILFGPQPQLQTIQAQVRRLGFKLIHVERESDLDVWR